MENVTETVVRGRPSPYSQEVIKAAIDALKLGTKVKDVAAATGMSVTSVTYYKHKLLPAKPKGKPVSQEEVLLSSIDKSIATTEAEIQSLETDLTERREALAVLVTKRERFAAALGV